MQLGRTPATSPATPATTSTGAAGPLPIAQVQGSGALSPYEGRSVTVSGVVSGIQRTGDGAGFFLQDPVGDQDAQTSDAIFVRMGGASGSWQDDVSVGGKATATGTVSERGGLTAVEVGSHRSVKLGGPPSVAALAPETLDIPVDEAARIGYLEAREGMLLTMADALVVGPTTTYGQYVAVDAAKHGVRRMGTTPDQTGFVHVNGRLGPTTQMSVGDRIAGIRGPLGFTNGRFELLPVGSYKDLRRGAQPPRAFGDIDGDDRFTEVDRAAVRARAGETAADPLDPADLNGDGEISRADLTRLDARIARQSDGPQLRIATLNVWDFFDSEDAPPPIDDEVPSGNQYRTKLAKLAGAIRDRLGSPDVLALQEVENTAVLDDLLKRPELRGLGYRYVQLPTTGRRSINPTLLYREDAAEVIGTRQLQQPGAPGVTELSVVDEPHSRESLVAGEPAPLFAREPLVVDLRLKGAGGDRVLTTVVTHLISKFSPHGLPTDEVRVQQATALREAVTAMRTEHPDREVVVLGDMNDTPTSPAMRALGGSTSDPTLVDATATMVPEGERYSYVYDGRSELIDHIFLTPGLADDVSRAGVRHGNADLQAGQAWDPTPARASDHDSPYVWIDLAKLDATAGAAAAQPKRRR